MSNQFTWEGDMPPLLNWIESHGDSPREKITDEGDVNEHKSPLKIKRSGHSVLVPKDSIVYRTEDGLYYL
jgi:hypothetical protein